MTFPTLMVLTPIVLLLLLVIARKCKDYFSPLRTVNVTLIDQYCDTYHGFLGMKTDYFLAFQAEDKKIVLLVTEEDYDSFKKGDSGILTYRNNTIINFQ